MPESTVHYFDLPWAEQAELLHGLAPMLGRRAEILEKDIWLCQMLGILFALPIRKPMAFKGGTSLSKVYQAIERFSEDIDVTIDYRSLVADIPDLAGLPNAQRRKLSDTLKAALIAHVTDELVPALRAALAQALPTHEIAIEVSDDAEKLWLYYPSAVENTDAYLRPSILIEFGGRNATLPQDADETPVPLLEPGSGKTRKAYVWAWARSHHDPQPGVIYEFCPGRGAQYPQAFLAGKAAPYPEPAWSGTLITDQYAGYHAVLDARAYPPRMPDGASRSSAAAPAVPARWPPRRCGAGRGSTMPRAPSCRWMTPSAARPDSS